MTEEKVVAQTMNKVSQLDEYLGEQRLQWTQKIKDLAEDLKSGDNLHEVASYTLSYRQILVENVASVSAKIRAKKATLDRNFKEAWIRYYQYEYKLNDKQREKFIDADMSEDLQIHESLLSHREFLTASIKTLDNMGFAIKQRMDMKQL